MQQFEQKMRTGLIVFCRYHSSRLPGKVLRKISGQEVLTYITDRLSRVKTADGVVVATSDDNSDDVIAEFCQAHQLACFRGPLKDVAQRALLCAQKYQWDYFVRICGDNIFADYLLIDRLINIAVQGRYHFTSNVPGRTFPRGISVEILQTKFYQAIIEKFESEAHREHMTSYLYEHISDIGPYFFYRNEDCPKAGHLKLALDDDADFRYLSDLREKMDRPHTEYLLKDIYQLIVNNEEKIAI